MATIILGGAPGSNWFPMLLPIIGLFIVIVSFEYLFKFIRRKLHHESHANTDMSAGFDSVEDKSGTKE